MKKLSLILIVAFSMMFVATSCKKEKTPEPEVKTPVTMVPVTVTVSIIEDDSTGVTISNPSIEFLDVNGVVDTVFTGITITKAPAGTITGGGPCSVTGTTPITYSTSIPDGSKFRMRIYSNTTSGATKVVDYLINQNSSSNDFCLFGTCYSCLGIQHNLVAYY